MNALASLSESARKIALDRFRLLQPHLEERRLLKAVARGAALDTALSSARSNSAILHAVGGGRHRDASPRLSWPRRACALAFFDASFHFAHQPSFA
jgi:hypothetical protein